MKILVTGGAGFIGSHVADAFIGEGHEVAIVDNLATGRRENVNPKARFVEVDIRSEQLGELMAKERFDIVSHHAAQMDVRRSVDDPLYDASVNIIGSLNLIDQSRRLGVKRFIFASTGGAVYGEQDYFPADENHPTRPLSPYGVSKLAVERYLHCYAQVHGLRYVILRYANVYGPRQNPHGEAGVVAIFAQRMLAGQQPLINGDGGQTRDYVFVGDVVRANLLALNYKESDVFNIGTGKETDVNRIFTLMRDLTRSSCRDQHGPAKAGEQRRSVLECSKAKKLLRWQPAVDVPEGLETTVQYFRTQPSR